MGKLIGKTVAITMAAFIGVLAITFGVLALACPNVLAKTFSSIGAYKASVHFMESQYDKSGEYSDLVIMVKALDEKGDANRTVKFCDILINDNKTDFDNYCKGDGKLEYGSEKSAKEFFYDKYAVAELYTGDVDGALEVADTCVKACGYTETNPFRSLIYDTDAKLNVEGLNKIKTKLNSVKYRYTAGSAERILADADLADLTKIIKDKNNTKGE